MFALAFTIFSRAAENGGGTHWAFQPIQPVEPPSVDGHVLTSENPIDRFIETRLEDRGLAMTPPAGRRTLIRRATFDLTGLPPTPAEIARFLDDSVPGAFARLIESLLASPRYGERWGRWWLDVARYADSNGQDENKVMANAWRYRDWVIRSFNCNQPFDQFITEQLAGDLLPTEGVPEKTIFDRWTATGFLVLGPKMLAEQDKPKLVMDLVDEQIDVVSRTFLGLTVACARCHDHKFDPIPTRDYYALAGIFRSTKTMANLAFVSKFNERQITSSAQRTLIDAHEKKLTAMTNEVREAVQRANESLLAQWRTNFPAYLAAASSSNSTCLEADTPWPTNAITRLRDLLSFDPSTNAVSKTLREIARDPETAASFLAQAGRNEDTEQKAAYEALFGSKGVFALPENPRPFYPVATREKIAALEKARDAFSTNSPAPRVFALAVEEDKPVDLPVHLRGSHLNPAKEPVPRGFIQVAFNGAPPKIPADQSGRMELARWLTSPDNPLTARVIVNRVWQAHFGEGLVRGADNFGTRGERPSHPELLDWLASRFIKSGWDLKALHRLIMTSATWQQAALPPGDASVQGASADPDNRLLWHYPRQRLDAEMIRDGLLAVAGRLDETAGGSLVSWKNDEYAPPDIVSAKSVRRSVYLPVVRDRVFNAFTIFDFANPGVCVAKRTPTVVSHQALFFLNSPLVKDSAKSFARNLLAAAPRDPAARVRLAYDAAFGRLPGDNETERALRFMETLPAGKAENPELAALNAWCAWCQILFAANEFVYRD